jgi:hypothetical protein
MENPNIVGDVEYLYANYAQIVATDTDLRIGFGDRRPPIGKVKPLVGIVMSHEFARQFVQIVARIGPALEKAKATLETQPQPPQEIP